MGSKRITALSAYRDQQFQGSMKEQEEKLKASSTLYVGNLAFFTTEDQIYHLFSKSGDVKRVVMGLDRHALTPCGFCFVEFYTREDAEDALRYVNGTRLDERIVRCDWDAGFVEGRQYGRGRSGGQVRDEFRADYDAGRGGFGKMLQNRVERFGIGGGGPDGPQRRFDGRGKRKWNDDGESSEGITDLRQKLRRSNPVNDPENSENNGASNVPSAPSEAEAETTPAESEPLDDTSTDVNNKNEDVENKSQPVASDGQNADEDVDVIREDDEMEEKSDNAGMPSDGVQMEWIE